MGNTESSESADGRTRVQQRKAHHLLETLGFIPESSVLPVSPALSLSWIPNVQELL
jgi:hypothetical protein